MSTIQELLPIVLILSLSGIFAGFLAGLLGIGGGIIFVPVYFIVFTNFLHIDPSQAILMATATSLATMIPTSTISAFSHYRNGNIDLTLLKRWFAFLLFGVFLGSILSTVFGGLWLSIAFGTVLMLSAINMLFLSKKKALFNELPSLIPGQAMISTFISCASTMLGIGGGTLSVPILTLFNIETKKAIGTASAIGLIICAPGAIFTIFNNLTNHISVKDAPSLTVGYICFLAVFCVIPFSMLMAPIGVKVNKKISNATIKKIYAVLLIITSIKMIWSGLS